MFYCSPMPSLNPSCSVNLMEVYSAVAVKILQRRRRKLHPLY